MRKVLVRTGLFVAATMVATNQPVFAADAIGQTLGNITGWAQGLLISLGVLGFVLGGAFFIFDHTIGGQGFSRLPEHTRQRGIERGRRHQVRCDLGNRVQQALSFEQFGLGFHPPDV